MRFSILEAHFTVLISFLSWLCITDYHTVHICAVMLNCNNLIIRKMKLKQIQNFQSEYQKIYKVYSYSQYNSSMSSTRKLCRFGGVFVTGGTGGFLLWKSPVRPVARVLRRDDCNFVPVNNFWAFDEITYTDNWTVIPLYCDIAEYICLYLSLVFYDVKYFYYKYYT